METGTPYLLYKDASNRKSNQKNLGTIKSSNLCTEIIEYSDEKESAVCNLASIALPAFIEKNEDGELYYDYEKYHYIEKFFDSDDYDFKKLKIKVFEINYDKFNNLSDG